LKVNTGGVIPVIFASSILAFPATIAQMFKGSFAESFSQQLGVGMPLYNLLFVVGIIFFAYFYTAIIFNPDDVAENMRKYGGFIPASARASGPPNTSTRSWRGLRWREPSISRSSRFCRSFLLSGLPCRADSVRRRLARRQPAAIRHRRAWASRSTFGGTSLLIVVGVAMDTVQQCESQLIMRHYDGFMKKTRIRGRRF
jgi:preprotein translocase subunit SecY